MVAAALALGRPRATGGSIPALGDGVGTLGRAEPARAAAGAKRVARLAARGFWRKVDVSTFRGAPAIRFNDPDMHLDLGAIAKGYGIDRATAASARTRHRATRSSPSAAISTRSAASPEGAPVEGRHSRSARPDGARRHARGRRSRRGDFGRLRALLPLARRAVPPPDGSGDRRRRGARRCTASRCSATDAIDADARVDVGVRPVARTGARRLARQLISGAEAIPLT